MTEGAGAAGPERLRENRSSSGMWFPLQRPKRLNDGNRLAESPDGGVNFGRTASRICSADEVQPRGSGESDLPFLVTVQ